MNAFALSLTAALLAGSLTFGGPIRQSSQRSAPTKLAHFEMGAYVAKDGTKLNVNIDKQLGGPVAIQLRDTKGTVYFERTLNAVESSVRLRLDLTELGDGDYQLKVSNGLEIVVRDLKITTQNPAVVTRTINVL